MTFFFADNEKITYSNRLFFLAGFQDDIQVHNDDTDQNTYK